MECVRTEVFECFLFFLEGETFVFGGIVRVAWRLVEVGVGEEEAGLTRVCTLGTQRTYCLMDR